MTEKSTNSSGFSLLEVLFVVAIIGILANIAIPAIQKALWKARAVAAIQDFRVFERALHEYERDFNTIPRNGTAKKPPHELDPYLGVGFSWQSPHPWVKNYVWENWTGRSLGRRLDIQYGFSLKKPDERIVEAIQRVYDGRFEKTVSSKYTFVISASENQ